MKKTLQKLALAAVLCAVATPLAAQQAQDNRPGVAVLPFAPGMLPGADRDTREALSIGVQQILITELSSNTNLRVVDRTIVRELLAEQDLGASGRVDAETAARIGRMVGAKYVVMGGYNEIEDVFYLDGRIVDTETSEVLRSDRVSDKRTDLYRIIITFGNRLTDGVRLPALTREQRQQQEARATQAPREAVVLYSMAQRLADQGRTDEARDLYRQITDRFPSYTHAREALRQMGGS